MVDMSVFRSRTKGGQLLRVAGLSPESQGQNMVLSVVCVPNFLGSGSRFFSTAEKTFIADPLSKKQNRHMYNIFLIFSSRGTGGAAGGSGEGGSCAHQGAHHGQYQNIVLSVVCAPNFLDIGPVINAFSRQRVRYVYKFLNSGSVITVYCKRIFLTWDRRRCWRQWERRILCPPRRASRPHHGH